MARGGKNKRDKKRGPSPLVPRLPPPPSSPVTRVVQTAALGPSLPPLIITYTNEPDSVAAWLQEHTTTTKNCVCLGLDTETKPAFTRQAALASKGPDTLQLALANGHCLVVHLGQMDIPCRPLSRVLTNHRIVKAGVEIDNDCLALHENKRLDVNGRLELRKLDKLLSGEEQEGSGLQDNDDQKPAAKDHSKDDDDDNNAPKEEETNRIIPRGLKGLSEHYVPGLTLPKVKRLQMSNWALPLSDDQIEYAAADAFAGAIVVETVVANSTQYPNHTHDSICQAIVANEMDIASLRADRAAKKKERAARKRAAEKQAGGGRKGRRGKGTNQPQPQSGEQ